MFKMLLKIISVGLLLFIAAGIATIVKGDVNHVSEGLFMALYLAVLISALIFIRRNRAISQFIEGRTNLPE